jgi:alpha-tubulin suppressor-like RCC1 family protein/uncharacterized protein YkwD
MGGVHGVAGEEADPMACANAGTPASVLTQDVAEAAVLCLVNEERAANGVPPLSLNIRLRTAARQHANDAKTLKWWAGGGSKIHVNPITGSTPQDRIKNSGYCPEEPDVPMNENGYTAWYQGGPQHQGGTTPQAAVTWWMNSPPHRDTLLDAAYTETGIAVVLGVAESGRGPDSADGGVIVVQTFGGCATTEPAITGEVWGWGENGKGQVGDNSTTNRRVPASVAELGQVVAVSGGGYHSLALDADGAVFTWGFNSSGQLGDGSTGDRHAPAVLTSLPPCTAIAGGGYHSLALDVDGIVSAWGRNDRGQLGDGSANDTADPVRVNELGDVIAIAAGFSHNLAITSDRVVYAWGNNESGQLGDGTTTDRAAPVRVGPLSDIVAIGAGFAHSIALEASGKVWAWGANSSGQLGDSTLVPKISPVEVVMPSLATPIVAIAAGGVHCLALEQRGQLWAWGGNAYGQVGENSGYDTWLPVQVRFMDDVTAIGAGFGHSLVIKRDGTARSFGANYSGQLGDDTVVDRYTPVEVKGPPPAFAKIAGGLHHTLAI